LDDDAAQMIASGGNRLFAIHGKNGLYRASGNRFCERCRLKNASIIWQTNQKIGIYRKCDKKAQTVYWEKRLRKE